MARFFYYWEIISRVCPAEKAGPAIRCIFIFLKKENKGCRFHPSCTRKNQINGDNFHDTKKKRIFTSQYTKNRI